MTLIQAVILGVIQGVTEFLPISSSGHLVLSQSILGLEEPQLLFNLFVHVGTLAAIVIVFRERIISLVRALVLALGGDRSPEVQRQLGLWAGILAAMFPTAVVALLILKFAPEVFSSVRIVGVVLLFNAAVLLSARWIPAGGTPGKRPGALGFLALGAAQGVAALPGLSRSGTTITSALWLGWDRTLAAEMSFIISIPAILGGTAWELFRADSLGVFQPAPYLVGTLVSAVVGYISLALLLKLLKSGRFWAFSGYCAVVGAAAVVWSLVG